MLLQIAEAPFMLSAGHVLKASEDAAISPVLELIERANPDLGVSMRLTLRP